MIDNLIVNVLKNSEYPYIINIIHNKHINISENHDNTYIDISIDDITNNTDNHIDNSHQIIQSSIENNNENETDETDEKLNEISLDYEQYENWNEVQIWNTPNRHRRRLRMCHKRAWRPFHYYTKRYWCKPIAPPKWDPYWIRRFKRIGRFIAVYPGIYAKNRFNFKKCAAFCRQNYGGLASIHSNHEKDQAKSACNHILSQPIAKNQRDYAGHWRGYSCFIGLRRPFKKWEDKSKMNYKYWQPGEPNNGGHYRVCNKRNLWGGCTKYAWRKHADEGCTELYGFHYGRWNDISCNAKRSCICQKPRGQIHGPFIAVSATRTHKEASLYCKMKYGTTLATIQDDNDNEHVMNACKAVTQFKSLGHCWVGLQRPFHEWDDGTNAEEKFTNWYPGEPNNKHEKCTELYTEHKGKWNDLSCNYKRYFVCNAQTALQRMDFHEREEMIAKRMRRHKQKWQQYQARAERAKIRKMYFERMRKIRAQQRQQKREEMQRQREKYRQKAFTKFSGIMKERLGTFGANSVFGDMYLKRRRMRMAIERQSEGYERKINQRFAQEKYKRKKKEMFKKDKEWYRDMEDKMWEDEMDDEMDDGMGTNEGALKALMEERVNPSAKRCVLFQHDTKLYEFCVNDDFVFMKKYIEKLRFNVSDGYKSYNDDDDDERFQIYKYEQAMIHDGDDINEIKKIKKIKKIDNDLRYVRVDEFIYNHNSNHRKQCFGKRVYRICLEYMNVDKDVILYVGIQPEMYSEYEYDEDIFLFGEDSVWNEVEYVNIDDGMDERRNNKIIKCLMFYESKICVIQLLKYDKDTNDEYRVIILTQMNEDDEDEYTHPEHDNAYE